MRKDTVLLGIGAPDGSIILGKSFGQRIISENDSVSKGDGPNAERTPNTSPTPQPASFPVFEAEAGRPRFRNRSFFQTSQGPGGFQGYLIQFENSSTFLSLVKRDPVRPFRPMAGF